MAAIQRKLVHKQFNSPMGLYSQENVKATLNRELKAFGADGIEIDENITKPLNLDKSAVLRAVEEEEQQIKCAGEFFALARQSRSRQRAAENVNNAMEPPHHALHQQLLDQIKTQYLSHQNDIVIDRETVMRINRMSTRRHLFKRDHSWPPVEHEAEVAHGGVTPSPTHSIDVLREKFNSPTRPVMPAPREQRPRTPKMEIALKEENNPTPKAKGFSAPETKAADSDLGLVAPKCEYYEQLMQQRPTTPTLKSATPPPRPRLKRQSYSLERGRARKRGIASGDATELPPPKPRPSANNSPTLTPKVQRRSIKLATELKICYDGDSEEEPKVRKATYDIDLETLPLPATPQTAAAAAATAKSSSSLPRKAATVIDSLAVKQQQQMALALATIGHEDSTQQLAASGRIVPITVQVEAGPQQQQQQQLAASVQQIYDNACNYLKMTPPASDEGNPVAPATYVSATSGIKLQRQDSTKSSCIPTPPPLPPPTLVQRAKLRPHVKDAQDKRRQGGIYGQELQHEAHVEIAQLEAKYVHIQQSITEHLRQIDAYMENAKTALQRTVQATPPIEPAEPVKPAKVVTSSSPNESWDMFASRQSPILAVESPLQAILRQIYCRAAGIQVLSKDQDTALTPADVPEVPAENVPIVERALEDLHKIAVALDGSEKHALLKVEHQTKPIAAKAQHVVIEDEGETTTASHVSSNEEEENVSLDYRHVSDVIANYEQLAGVKIRQQEQKAIESEEKEQKQELEKDQKEQLKNKQEQRRKFKEYLEQAQLLVKRQKQEQEDLKEKEAKQQKENEKETTKQMEEQEKQEKQEPITATATESTQTGSPGCAHEAIVQSSHNRSSRCSICGECRDSPHGWGKLTKADQWRFDNLHNEPLVNYKSTYEVRSPYISRQISWEDAQQQPAQQVEQPEPKVTKAQLQRQRSEIEIVTTSLAAPADAKDWQLSRSPSPAPIRKYPAPLIETAQRCSSPFGLNAVQPRSTPSPTPTPALEAKFSHVPQLEGHNIGLLVRTATEPLQQSMSNSSSLLAGTPPATPRCNSQPPPFDFLMQHGFSNEDLPSATRDFSINRSFDNISPRPYIGIEGYKRVAWPPASEERIVREFTPQPPTQSPAPGAGGYYPQSVAPAASAHHQPAPNAASPQGPIYNNVRNQQQPQQQQHQQHHQQQPAHNNNVQYGQATTNYASNGYAPATVATTQNPSNNYNYSPQQQQQQPVQYTQAQFNRQRSREPTAPVAPAETPYNYHPHQQQQQQQPQQQPEQTSYQQHQANYPGGWKHIGAPLPKTHSEFNAGGVAPATAYPSYQQQHHQQQQQQQYQQQPQQQYRAPSYDNYQQQQHQPQQQQQPAPQHWQQQQQQPQQQQQYQAPYQTSPYQQPQQQQHQSYPQQNGGAYNAQPQYNSYSQPQQQQQQHQLPYSQDQPDQHGYRGASPGIITLRKEAPVSQQPQPVYTSQPAAVNYRGGSKLRGDLKWPPQEYKEAAVKENEERRLLALGPVCRPRRVNRDYTNFFAKHQLNNAYPSYKVPPGTQHMFA